MLNSATEISRGIEIPHFMEPEGIMIYHTASNYLFKKTILNDAGKHGR